MEFKDNIVILDFEIENVNLIEIQINIITNVLLMRYNTIYIFSDRRDWIDL